MMGGGGGIWKMMGRGCGDGDVDIWFVVVVVGTFF